MCHLADDCFSSIVCVFLGAADACLFSGQEQIRLSLESCLSTDAHAHIRIRIHSGTGQAFGRSLVVHDKDGKKMGCAALSVLTPADSVSGILHPYAPPLPRPPMCVCVVVCICVSLPLCFLCEIVLSFSFLSTHKTNADTHTNVQPVCTDTLAHRLLPRFL